MDPPETDFLWCTDRGGRAWMTEPADPLSEPSEPGEEAAAGISEEEAIARRAYNPLRAGPALFLNFAEVGPRPENMEAFFKRFKLKNVKVQFELLVVARNELRPVIHLWTLYRQGNRVGMSRHVRSLKD